VAGVLVGGFVGEVGESEELGCCAPGGVDLGCYRYDLVCCGEGEEEHCDDGDDVGRAGLLGRD